MLTSFVQYGAVASRNYVTDFSAYVENNWTPGLLTRFSYFNNSISPTQGNTFIESFAGMDSRVSSYKAAGVGATLKFNYQKIDMNGKYYNKEDAKLIFRKFPDLVVDWQWADRSLFNSELNYTKFNVQLRQNVRLQKLGYFQYSVEAGKTWGTVPYPYLNVPFGNQLILHDDEAFNLMNFLEYTCDRFVTVHVQQHVGGLLMDRIPLLNKLKWRNFIFARAYWGDIT